MREVVTYCFEHKLSLDLELLWLGRTLYLLEEIVEGLPRLLGVIDTGGIFADKSLVW